MNQELWDKLDNLRGSEIGSLENFAALLKKECVTIEKSDLPKIATFLFSKLGRYAGIHLTPEWLLEVFRELVKDVSYRTICDPWAGMGILLGLIKSENHGSHALAFTRNEAEATLGKVLVKDATWEVGEPLHLLHALENELDLVASILPFGVKANSQLSIAGLNGKRVELRDDLDQMVLASAASRLSEDGLGLFVIKPSFFFSQRSVLQHFNSLGLGIEAAFALPSGTFSPYTAIRSYLLIVRKRQIDQMFIAQLSSDLNTNLQIISNFKQAKEGGSLELGRFVEPETFKGLDYIRSAEKMKQKELQFGAKAEALVDLATSIFLGRRGENFEFQTQDNSIFIPLIGTSNVVNSVEELSLKAHNYAQIAIDPTRSDASFIAKFLNSEFGREIRQKNMAGAHIPKLNKQTLKTLLVFVPDLQTQMKMVEIEGKIVAEQNILLGLQNELADFHRELWGNPQSVANIGERLLKLSNRLPGSLKQHAVESLDQWFETLPFPMASILRAWQAAPSQDFKTKHEHLLHFFEGTAEFLGVILLSAFSTNDVFFADHKRKLAQALETQKLSFERATFGTWKIVIENLAKQARELLSEDIDSRALCMELFQDSSPALPEMLSSKELVEILSRTNKMRNDWTGHGGVVGQEEAQIRNEQLLQEVQKLRALMTDVWFELQLIRCLHCRPRHGVFANEITVMTGSNSEFLQEERQMKSWLDVEHLHLSRKGASNSLRLLPLIQVGPSPQSAKNACYFFNRLEKDGVRFISYHFVDKPELKGSFEEALKTIKFLTEC